VLPRPRLPSDAGPSYIARGLADYLDAKQIDHMRGAHFHPQTQGKIQRW
jgi:putative transposase